MFVAHPTARIPLKRRVALSIVRGDRAGCRSFGTGLLLSAAAPLDQQRQKEENVNSEDNEEYVAEPLTASLLKVALDDTRDLKWIERLHSYDPN